MVKGATKHKVVIAIDGLIVFSGYLNDEEYKNFSMADPNPQQLLDVREEEIGKMGNAGLYRAEYSR